MKRIGWVKSVPLLCLDLQKVVWEVVVNGIVGSAVVFPHLRWRLLCLAGVDASHCRVRAAVHIGSRRVRIERGAFVNSGCFIDGAAQTVIGADSSLGYGVMLVTASHRFGSHQQRAGAAESEPITIGKGCWLGARVTVLPGVTIADGCVIAAGSVVTADCAEDGLYAGVPARRLRSLSN